jgi:uncharacterized protein YndB with AHSA1/START domain
MEAYGEFLGPDVFRLVRVLPGAPEEVWEHLTQSQWLAGWLAPGQIEPRLGGLVSFRWQEVSDGVTARGVVSAWDPPRRLAYTWNERSSGSEVTFELEPEGPDRVRLTLVHRRMPPGEVLGFAHGWHACLDALAAQMRGQTADAVHVAWSGRSIDQDAYRRNYEALAGRS